MCLNSVACPAWCSVTDAGSVLPAANSNVASTTVRKNLVADSAKISNAGCPVSCAFSCSPSRISSNPAAVHNADDALQCRVWQRDSLAIRRSDAAVRGVRWVAIASW